MARSIALWASHTLPDPLRCDKRRNVTPYGAPADGNTIAPFLPGSRQRMLDLRKDVPLCQIERADVFTWLQEESIESKLSDGRGRGRGRRQEKEKDA